MRAKRPWARRIFSKTAKDVPVTPLETIAPPASVRAMFDHIAPNYDRFNAWASLGLHQGWRKALVKQIPAGATVLDIATGTGDLALLAHTRGHEVTGLDFSESMLAQARKKDVKKDVRWIQGSADCLPFE